MLNIHKFTTAKLFHATKTLFLQYKKVKGIQNTEKKPVKMFQYINSNQNVVTFINVVMKGLMALLQTETMTLVVTTPN